MTTSWTLSEITVRLGLLEDLHILMKQAVDVTSGIFQIRPHKEFSPLRGRDRLLSLQLFADLRHEEIPLDSDPSSIGSISGNAYDFMRTRRDVSGDPILKRWYALVRLSNFAAVESSPLCVIVSSLFSMTFF